MEIKIVCDCGQKYIFSVDPENGQMPVSVNCPACGADGTKEADEILSQIFPDAPAEAAVATAPPPPAVAEGGPVRINPPVRLTAVASAPPPFPAAIPSPQFIGSVAAAAPRAKATGEFSLGLGILGAVVGAGLGAGLMYGFFDLVGFRFPLMGVGIGALAGYGARLLGRGTDATLGIIAAVLAVAANAGTLYLIYGEFEFIYLISLAVGGWFAYRLASG